MSAKENLIEELRRHALVIGEVTLTSGATAQYYVDAKRAILRPTGFAALSELVAGFARQWEATARGAPPPPRARRRPPPPVGGDRRRRPHDGRRRPGLCRAGGRRRRQGLLR